MGSPKIFLIEDHHQAFEAWRKEQYRELPLVHLDAHIDFGFYHAKPTLQVVEEAKSIKDLTQQLNQTLLYTNYKKDLEAQLNIGNYIYPAMRDGIVSQFFWVIPGSQKIFKSCSKEIGRLVKFLKTQDPHPAEKIESSPEKTSTSLYNRYFEIASLFSVRKMEVPLLLDIDVDFSLFNSIKSKEISLTKTLGERRPWIYPDELVKIVRDKFPKAVCVTIAYSVNGAFTPIEYKFFGDEISLRLKNLVDRELEAIFLLRNRGMDNFFKGRLDLSAENFKEAIGKLKVYKKLEPDFNSRFLAHLHFWLYRIYWQAGKKPLAKENYARVLAHDPAYRVRDNNLGPLYLRKEDFLSARREFEKILYCDPKDFHAWCGKGDVLFRQKKYSPALAAYQAALKINPAQKEALFGAAECQYKLGRLVQIRKGLAALKSSEHSNPYWHLIDARLKQKDGEFEKALFSYKEVVMLGGGGMEVYREVFPLFRSKKNSDLFVFFKQKFEDYRDDFYKRQRKFLLKQKKPAQVKKMEKDIKKIACLI